jgi:hypothetical protein
VFACAVHEAVQLVLHFVVQLSLGGTAVHFTSQWSLQHAPQDASQSVPVADDEQLALQLALQRASHAAGRRSH